MVLLINAGMPLRDTLKKVSEGKEDICLYKEIHILLNDINNSMSELEAIKAFSDRCNILEIKKFLYHSITEFRKRKRRSWWNTCRNVKHYLDGKK